MLYCIKRSENTQKRIWTDVVIEQLKKLINKLTSHIMWIVLLTIHMACEVQFSNTEEKYSNLPDGVIDAFKV